MMKSELKYFLFGISVLPWREVDPGGGGKSLGASVEEAMGGGWACCGMNGSDPDNSLHKLTTRNRKFHCDER